MKYDNFNAVDNGFANIVGTPIGTMSGTMTTTTLGSSAPAQYVWKTISHCFDAYSLFDRAINEIAPIPTGLFSGTINAMNLKNRYLFIFGQAYTVNVATTSPVLPPYTMNDLNTMQSNFKIRLRPLAMAYANNPTTANMTNLSNQINLLNAGLASKGLRFNMQIGGF
jgi:hypothetical protein